MSAKTPGKHKPSQTAFCSRRPKSHNTEKIKKPVALSILSTIKVCLFFPGPFSLSALVLQLQRWQVPNASTFPNNLPKKRSNLTMFLVKNPKLCHSYNSGHELWTCIIAQDTLALIVYLTNKCGLCFLVGYV